MQFGSFFLSQDPGNLDSTDKKIVSKLRGGESAFLTLEASSTYQCFVATAETVIEYGIFA